MNIKNPFTEALSIRLPVIMAPMFLVSNKLMIEAAMRNGIMGVFPSLNFRKEAELRSIIQFLQGFRNSTENKKGNFGVNLIVQKSNVLFEKHLAICVEEKVPFYITSLGNPKKVIDAAHTYGAKVYCDVTTLTHAQKCHDLDCDGFIAVGQGAGGHAGDNPLHILVPALQKAFPDKPVIAAGGIATGEGILTTMSFGASGVSIGTRFIASEESSVSMEYKNAIVSSGMDDIVLSERISGTPCTIINTPYAKKIGYRQNYLERLLSRNPTTKKYFKMLTQIKGMGRLSKSIRPGSYNTLWCAGKSVELIRDIKSCEKIIDRLEKEFDAALEASIQIQSKNLSHAG